MRKLDVLSVIAFFFLIFNSLFLCHLFIILALNGEYLVTEPNQELAVFEVLLTLGLVALGVERLVKLCSKNKGGK